MKNRNICIVGFSLVFGMICFIWGVLWMEMCLDYEKQVNRLEKELTFIKSNH